VVTGGLLQHFARNAGAPLVLTRGDGVHVWDDRGRRHVDGLSALYCAQLGYGYGAEFAAAAAAQMTTLPFATNWGVASPPALALAEALGERTGLRHAFLTSGGSEAVEAAWKLVRQVHLARGEAQRTKVVARRIAYHGVTLGALALTGVDPYKAPFGRPPIDVHRAATTNAFRPEVPDPLADVERAIDEAGPDEVAMVIAEPVQNAGGCLVAPEGYWRGLRELCDRTGALLVADEVICGFGRLGHWLGTQRYGVTPDLVTVAKGITSAYAPMGAVLVRDEVAAPLFDAGRTLLHGITFGGHPVSAAVALKNVEVFERDGVLENVRALEPHLDAAMEALRALPIVGDVRGEGFFRAAELVGPDGERLDAATREGLLRGFLPGRMLDAGLIARADDRGDAVVQIAPPLISDRGVLDEITGKLGEVLEDAGRWLTARTSSGAEMAVAR
jgi:adenosylmethionine-8-amino-7-oxononanoate aminotransferase